MNLKNPSPRLLPFTMIALGALIAVKATVIVRSAAFGPGEPARVEAAGTGVVSIAHASPANEPRHTPVQPTSAPPPPVAPSPAPAEPGMSEADRAILLDLRKRREELDAHERAIAAREAVVAAAEHKLAGRVDELQALQKRLEGLESARAARDEANWRGLVKLYESMKPRDAANIFNDLDMPVLLQIMDRMKEAKAALIVGSMQPDKARQLTAELAQMRTKANTPGGSRGG
ncbi:MAG: hypothetical protein JO110_29940 [Acetobacteraceae bacterium]|nr:hypothetical protein [Acetobacteraceae bacterium]